MRYTLLLMSLWMGYVGCAESPIKKADVVAVPTIREQVNSIVAKDVARLTSDKLEAYLQSLVAIAKANGKATALEVEPGLRAIRQLLGGGMPGIRREAAFVEIMLRINQGAPK